MQEEDHSYQEAIHFYIPIKSDSNAIALCQAHYNDIWAYSTPTYQKVSFEEYLVNEVMQS